MKNKNASSMRLIACFSGTVQGVGFRYATVSQAQRFDVTGYVKNLRNGRVELVAEGSRLELEKFLESLKSVFQRNVKEVQTTFEPASGQFEGFGIEH